MSTKEEHKSTAHEGDKQQRNIESGPVLLTKKQLASVLNVSVRTISKWQKKGHLPVIKIGGRCLYPWPAVQDQLEREFGRNFR